MALKGYKKIYANAFGYCEQDFVPSELSGKRAVDIHHIECKGSGGDPLGNKDRIENLIAVTREEHLKYGDKKQYMLFLFKSHRSFLISLGVTFDQDYLDSKIEYYAA